MSTSDAIGTFFGHVGSCGQITEVAGGHRRIGFTFAVSRRIKRAGEWQDQTSWWKIEAWDGYADRLVEQGLEKGVPLTVFGEPYVDTWQTTAGDKRQQACIAPLRIVVHPRWERRARRGDGDGAGDGASTTAAAPAPMAPAADEEPPF